MEKISLKDIDRRDKAALCDKLVSAYLKAGDCTPSDKTLFNEFYEASGAPTILEEYKQQYTEMGYNLEYTPDEVFDLYITIMT